MDGRGTPDGNNLEAVSTLKGSHRDKFYLGATFHPRWRRLPFSEQSQPAQPASLVYHRRHIAGGRVVGETLSLSKEKEEERERLLGVAAVTQLRPHLICLKYTAPPAEVLMATRPHPLLSLSLLPSRSSSRRSSPFRAPPSSRGPPQCHGGGNEGLARE